MSKIVTQRFEYVNYDDAGLTLGSSGVVTAYPVATDIYSNNATATTGSSYGSAVITAAAGSTATVNIPAGSTVTMIGAAANTVNANVAVGGVSLVPGGPLTSLAFPVCPSQIVTLPGVFNSGTLSIGAINSAGVVTSAAVSIQLLWSV